MALIDRSLTLIEYGEPSIFNVAEWEASGMEEGTRLLETAKVITVRRTSKYIVLEPRQFVGHLHLPGRSLTITPRFPGLFASLRQIASFASKSIIEENNQVRAGEEHLVDIARSYLSALECAAYAGLPVHYTQTVVETSHPRGHILFSKTFARYHMHGVRHKVVSSQAVKTILPGLSTVVKTVASILEASYPLSPSMRLILPNLLFAFGTGGVAETAQALSIAEDLEKQLEEWPEILKLLTLSKSVLLGEKIVWTFEMPVPDGECRFCDMNRLWEIAITQAFRQCLFGRVGYEVDLHPISGNMKLLQGGGPSIDPDIVVYNNGQATIIIDAKNSLAKSVVADDVYQVLCYARRMSAGIAVLVYLTAGPKWLNTVGISEDGVTIIAVGIPVHNTYRHLTAAAAAITETSSRNESDIC